MKALTPEKIKEVKEYFKMEEDEPISFQNWPDGLELKDKEALVELYNWMIKFKKRQTLYTGSNDTILSIDNTILSY